MFNLNILLCRVDHLIEGHDYNFRVRAVNKYGESQPLTGQTPVTAKDPYGKPDKPGTPEATGMPICNLSLSYGQFDEVKGV